jgi:hypothetical protein
MKRLICIALLLCGLYQLTAQTTDNPAIARIREMTGTVEIKPPGSTAWIPASTERELSRDTLLSTGFKSTAVLILGNSTIIVRPLTRLSLAEIIVLENTEQVSLNLRSGRVRAEINPPPGNKTDFSVKGPTVTASVRGTIFEFDTINLRVWEGTVNLTLHQTGKAVPQTTPVRAGESSFVDTFTGTVAAPLEVYRSNLSPRAPAGRDETAGVITPPGGSGVQAEPDGTLVITVELKE